MKILAILLMLAPCSLMGAELRVIGTAMLEYGFFKVDVYEISYLKGENGVEELALDYKVDVKREHSLEGWEVGLKHAYSEDPGNRSKAKWIRDHTVAVKKGDKLVIRRNGDEVSILKNGKLLGKTNDEAIARMAFEPWIGKTPIDADIKKQLLSKD